MEEKKEMKCSIIQDLLPSYADDICSNDTKELIEEHTAQCPQCREKLEQMKNTSIVAGKAANKQIDYLKKVRCAIRHKEQLGKLLLAILTGITFIGLFVRYGGLINYEQIPSAIFSILLLCAAALAGNCQHSGKSKATKIETVVSCAVFIFSLTVNEYVVQYLVASKIPFSFLGLELNQTGPFYTAILKISALMAVILLARNTFGKHKNAYATVLSITALVHIAYTNDWLYHMDTPDSCLRQAHELAISQVILAIAGIIAYALLQKFRKVPTGTEKI